MCNYYDRHRPASEFQRAFGFIDPIANLEPRYVVRPTDAERVIAIGKDGARHFPAMRWGLVPPGSSDRQWWRPLGLAAISMRDPSIDI
jgi:putative SOS response-associated peptidase YedK